jgi:AcrR family transcriptional regulator/DNA-binding MarR family transcriptional regulator
MASSRRLRMRHPVPGPRGGGLYVSELQRTRLLEAAFAVIAEQGYRRMAVRKVSERAGVSSKTFYDLFTDREDCFLAAFDHAVDELVTVARGACEGESDWAARIRAGLGALLAFLDGEPELCRLVFVEALGAGPRVLERRARVLKQLESVIDEGRTGVKEAAELPSLTAEGVVSATFGVIHARLSQQQSPEPLTGLLNSLMGMIVLPYRGRKAAAQELAHPVSKAGPRALPAERLHLLRPADKSRFSGPAGRTSGSRAGLTVRTYAVLAAVSEHPGVSNREVSDLVRVSDQGQISRLMARLAEQGLLENAGGHIQGVAKAWRLTARGEELVHANRPAARRTDLPRVRR